MHVKRYRGSEREIESARDRERACARARTRQTWESISLEGGEDEDTSAAAAAADCGQVGGSAAGVKEAEDNYGVAAANAAEEAYAVNYAAAQILAAGEAGGVDGGLPGGGEGVHQDPALGRHLTLCARCAMAAGKSKGQNHL